MKKHLGKSFLLLLVCMFLLPAVSYAGRQHSLGVDMVRIVDKAQYDALFNIYYQFSLTNRTAVVGGFSTGDDVTIAEIAYKYYLKKYFDGPFGQVGLSFGDYFDDTEFGITGAIGFEKSIVKHIVVSCAVEITVGSMDNYATGDSDPIFRPILSVIFAF